MDNRYTLFALTVFIGCLQTASSAECIAPRWFEKKGARTNSLVPLKSRDLIKHKDICSLRCLATEECVTLDLVKTKNKQWYCLLYDNYTATINNPDSSHWIFTVPCRMSSSSAYAYFAYMGRYTIGSTSKAAVKRTARNAQDCVKQCFTSSDCEVVSYSADSCLLASGHHILNPWKEPKNDSFLFSKTWPIKEPTYGEQAAVKQGAAYTAHNHANRLQAAIVQTMTATTRDCTYQYMGQYDITASEHITVVRAANVKVCLEKCSQSDSCQLASYSNGVCLHSADEGQTSLNLSLTRGTSVYFKQRCSFRTPTSTSVLLSMFEVVFVVFSFTLLF